MWTLVWICRIKYNNPITILSWSIKVKLLHINPLKTCCASGVDSIGSWFIKRFHKVLTEPLVYIIKLIFNLGKVSIHFKTTFVTPMYTIRVTSKAITPLVYLTKRENNWLVALLNVNNVLLLEKYFAFINGLYQSDALYEFTKIVTQDLDYNRTCLAVS